MVASFLKFPTHFWSLVLWQNHCNLFKSPKPKLGPEPKLVKHGIKCTMCITTATTPNTRLTSMKVRFGSQVAELGWTELWNNVGNFIPWTPAYWKPRACSLGTCKIALSSQMSPPGLDHLPSVELIINGTCSASGNISPCDGPWLTCQSPITQPPLSIARLDGQTFRD